MQEIQKIMDKMERRIIGERPLWEKGMIALLAQGHVLIEDLPGVGKTMLAKTLAQSVDCQFSRIQFTPDTLPGDVTGTSIYNMATGEFQVMQGAVMSNIVLADEINRTSPKTQASLLEAMEEGQVTIDGKSYMLPKPFMVIATQNPIEQLGTYQLPEAQLDRFLMRLHIGYPEFEQEVEMVTRYAEQMPQIDLDKVVSKEALNDMIEEAAKVSVVPELFQYMTQIVCKTRESTQVVCGASPRATIALAKAAKAAAYLSGRNYVVPDDVKKVAVDVLAHRIILSNEELANKRTSTQFVEEIVRNLAVPIF